MPVKSEITDLTTGPYALRPSTGEVFGVSRIHEDDHSAFIGGSVTSTGQSNAFGWLNTEVRKFNLKIADLTY